MNSPLDSLAELDRLKPTGMAILPCNFFPRANLHPRAVRPAAHGGEQTQHVKLWVTDGSMKW